MTERERAILDIIKKNPLITQKDLSNMLGIERSSVAVHIGNLIKKGVIKGKGYVIDECPYVCVIGGANVDILGKTEGLKAGDSAMGAIMLTPGGVGRNIAEALGRLGVDTHFISAVGSDLYGDMLIESLRKTNVDPGGIKVVANKATGVYMAMLEQGGDMAFAINDMGIVEEVDSGWLDQQRLRIQRASEVIIDTNLSEEAIEMVSGMVQGHLFADPVSVTKASKLKNILPKLWGIKPNRLEAELLSGVTITSEEDLIQAITVLHDRGVKHVVVSLGEEGLLASDQNEIRRFVIPTSKVLNVTGAGDVFIATWAASTQEGMPFFEGVKRAMLASHFTLQTEQTIHPHFSQTALNNYEKEVTIYETVLRHSS